MKMFLRARYALAGAVAFSLLTGAARADDGAVQAVFEGADESKVDNAAFLDEGGSVDLVQFQSGVGAGLNLSTNGCTHQIVAGGEFLMVRANHSQALAFVEVNTVDLATNGEFIRFHQFDFDYDASFRGYIGCRIPECGQEFRLTYTNFNSDGDFSSFAQTTTQQISSPFEVVPAATATASTAAARLT